MLLVDDQSISHVIVDGFGLIIAIINKRSRTLFLLLQNDGFYFYRIQYFFIRININLLERTKIIGRVRGIIKI